LLLVRLVAYFHIDWSWYEPSLESVGPFSCRIADGVLHISWYDHEGIIMTNGPNQVDYKYFDYYLAVLFILQRFDGSAWVGLKTRISGVIEMGPKTRLLSPWMKKCSYLI